MRAWTEKTITHIKEYILEEESHSDIEKQILTGNLNAVYAGRLTVRTSNLIARSFYSWRNKNKRLKIDQADKTYLDWVNSVVAGKYDAALSDLYGFGKIAMRELKEAYVKEIEMSGSQYYAMYI